MKTDLFQSCGHCWVFQICWHIACSSFTASSFRIWNSSTGISSPPLALFVVMLSKAHLTSHSRMSGSRWVITPLWLSGSWRSFLYSSSVYSCHRFLISSASVAESLQLCPTLCNLIDRSPQGSPVPGILQARVLEWVAIASSSSRRQNGGNLGHRTEWRGKKRERERENGLSTKTVGSYRSKRD